MSLFFDRKTLLIYYSDMKIRVDQNICIGAAPCVAIASKTFDLDEKGKAFVKNVNGDTEDLIKQAAESCPVQAIFLYDDTGKQVYPPV